MRQRTISIMIPTYNEEENVRPIYEAVRNEIENELPEYSYEILFIDMKLKMSYPNIVMKYSLLITSLKMTHEVLFRKFVLKIRVLKQYLMLKILGNLIVRIMA